MGSVSLSQGDSGYSVTATASWTTGPKVTINITYNSGEWSWRIRGRNPDTKVYLEGTGSTRTASFDAIDGKDYAFQVFVAGSFSNGHIFTVDFDSDSGGSGSGSGGTEQTSCTITLNTGGFTWDNFPSNNTMVKLSTQSSVSLPTLTRQPQSSNNNAFTIIGDANGGNSNTSCTALSTTTTTYTFDGWYDGWGNYVGTVYSGTTDVTLTPKQPSSTSTSITNNTLNLLPKPTRNNSSGTYNIFYNGNGGTSSKSSDTAVVTTSYTFGYWCSNKEGTGTIYSDSTSFNTETTVYAKWNSSNAASSVILPTASREGYTFVGWAESPSAEFVYTDTYNPSNNNTTLYAQWMVKDNISYTVNHHIKNLGSSSYSSYSSENKTATGDTVLTLSNLKINIDGYTYKEGKVNGNVVTTTTVKTDGSLAINLYYDRNVYTVSITKPSNVQSVSGAGSYEYGASVVVEAVFDTSMYHFTSWSGSSSININTNPATFTIPTSNISISPNVENNTYRIIFDGNGDDGSGYTAPMDMVVGTSKTLSANGYQRSGYIFAGWNTKANGSGTSYSNGQNVNNLVSEHNGTITLYAQWRANTFTITYDANGGSGAPSAGTKYYNEPYIISSTRPTRNGYNFYGWGTSSGATSAAYQPGDNYTENTSITLYAIWTVGTYSVRYNANGGSGAPSAGTKKHGTTYTISSVKPTRTGYTFLGWATSSGATTASYQPGSSYTSNASVTFYAVWKAITYNITYDANGGSGVPSAETKTHDIAYTISNTKPTRDGYNFAGWATSSGATTASYQPGGSYTENKSITLYAVWSIDTFTNTINHILRGFKNNDGNTESGSGYLIKSETFTNTYKLAINLNTSNAISDIPNGFVLNNQYGHVNENGGITYYNMNSTIYQEDSNMTFNFYYDPIEYSISYNLNGGNNDSSNPATYNVLYGVTLNKPNKPGSRFSVWTNDKNVTITGINDGKTATFTNFENLKTELATRSTGAITVHANWETLGSTNIPGVGTYQCFIYRNNEWRLCAPHIVKDGVWEPY